MSTLDSHSREPSSHRGSLDKTLNDEPMSLREEPPAPPPSTEILLTGRKLLVLTLAMSLALMLVALDQTILATALPKIASDFDAFTLQGWVSSSFILSQTVFLLFYGQLLRIFPAKHIALSSITIFEIGSLVCGVSRNVNQLIAGRTVSGLGGAGIFVSMVQVISQVTRLEDRPRIFGIVGAVFGLSSVIGPLIGGALTDHSTWRWCFFINLPIGFVCLAVVTVVIRAQPPLGSDPAKRSRADIWDQCLQMDFFGALLIAGAVTSLVLALQWGGNTKSWDDAAVIVSLVFAFVLSVVFILWEIWMKDRAMVPTAIFHSRSVYAIIVYCFLLRFSLLLFSYYIPIFYQAARHRSATDSGIDLLPYMLGVVLTLLGAGQVVGFTGYYHPFLVGAPIFLAIGSGLLFTLNASSSSARLVGFQILAGIGTGMGMQNSLIAMQAELRAHPKLLAQATSMASFAQFLGGTLGLGVAEPVFSSQLIFYLGKYAPEAPALVRESPTSIYTELALELIPGVVRSYTEALRRVFVLGVPVAGVALFAALFIKNIRLNEPEEGKEKKAEEGEKSEA
ncbi:ABC transporter [Roridomyces roridus]|uniref:ABC transporter n=1 Tax=Roridomyces roridus TaxID=1738132 RepID=A0AAD7C1C0_9AGAR|nr:ABC transporter [Roridomyces roridus]